MEIAGVGAAGTSGQTEQSQKKLTDNFDTFLNLLTAQLQNQDPLSPMDTTQFTEQLVAYSEVEQSIAVNKNLETLISLAQNNQAGSAIGYLGHDVIINDKAAGLINGKAEWQYTLPANAKNTTLTVTDASGKAVFTSKGQTGAGAHAFTWDGRGTDGSTLPDGVYKLVVTARDEKDSPVSVDTKSRGRVTAVDFAEEEPRLTVNGALMPVSKVASLIENTK